MPDRLKDLYKEGDYGRYADENGDLSSILSVLTSLRKFWKPVINAYGDLIGTAFDGNWEAMSGDIAFENEVQRTISVDIRYILFIIDKFAGAGYLVDEMTIAPKRPSKMSEAEKIAAELAAKEDPLTIVTS